jgi:hypothetical protein
MVIIHGDGEFAHVQKLSDGSWLIQTAPYVRLETREETHEEACRRLVLEAQEHSLGVTGHA